MVNQQLVNYIQSNLQRGVSLQQIKQSLLAQGWSDYDINEAVNLAQGQSISKPSKKLFLVISIIVVIVIAGIFAFFMFGEKETTEPTKQEITPTTPQQEVDYEDCGSSDTCFTDYVKTCTPAKATISDQGLTYIETIEGYEGNDCILTLIYTESPVPGFVGKEMTCKVPKSNLSNFKDYLQGEKMKQSCEGPLLDFLIQMGAE